MGPKGVWGSELLCQIRLCQPLAASTLAFSVCTSVHSAALNSTMPGSHYFDSRQARSRKHSSPKAPLTCCPWDHFVDMLPGRQRLYVFPSRCTALLQRVQAGLKVRAASSLAAHSLELTRLLMLCCNGCRQASVSPEQPPQQPQSLLPAHLESTRRKLYISPSRRMWPTRRW